MALLITSATGHVGLTLAKLAAWMKQNKAV